MSTLPGEPELIADLLEGQTLTSQVNDLRTPLGGIDPRVIDHSQHPQSQSDMTKAQERCPGPDRLQLRRQ